MALITVNPGDVARAVDINQLVNLLTGVDAGDIILSNGKIRLNNIDLKAQVFTGSVAANTQATITHGLGRTPALAWGFWGTSQANADGASAAPMSTHAAIASSALQFEFSVRDWSTSIHIRNSNTSSTLYYRIYVL